MYFATERTGRSSEDSIAKGVLAYILLSRKPVELHVDIIVYSYLEYIHDLQMFMNFFKRCILQLKQTEENISTKEKPNYINTESCQNSLEIKMKQKCGCCFSKRISNQRLLSSLHLQKRNIKKDLISCIC